MCDTSGMCGDGDGDEGLYREGGVGKGVEIERKGERNGEGGMGREKRKGRNGEGETEKEKRRKRNGDRETETENHRQRTIDSEPQTARTRDSEPQTAKQRPKLKDEAPAPNHITQPKHTCIIHNPPCLLREASLTPEEVVVSAFILRLGLEENLA